MTREELTTIIGLLEKVEDKRLAWGTMWDEERGCGCAQGVICPRVRWDGQCTLAFSEEDFVNESVARWATTLVLSPSALNELEAINDSIMEATPEERYQEVMKELRSRL